MSVADGPAEIQMIRRLLRSLIDQGWDPQGPEHWTHENNMYLSRVYGVGLFSDLNGLYHLAPMSRLTQPEEKTVAKLSKDALFDPIAAKAYQLLITKKLCSNQ